MEGRGAFALCPFPAPRFRRQPAGKQSLFSALPRNLSVLSFTFVVFRTVFVGPGTAYDRQKGYI